LCAIAQTRANQQAANGGLSHDGFQAQAETQKAFMHIAEVLHYWSDPRSAHEVVYDGWKGSDSHRNTILDGSWTHGCGATAGLYHTFIFARP
jgi:uncharacterized protein YkwD